MPRPIRSKTAVHRLFENEDLLIQKMSKMDFLDLVGKGKLSCF